MRNWHGNLSPFGRWHTAGALSVYAVVGLEPPLVLDFDETFYRTGGTATDLVSAATHTRATSATYVDANGILQTAAINEPRVGHHIYNGSAWVDEGYFHESEARTNLLHTTDTLVTQSYTVTAVPHTLHFTGTGTVTLSGASTAGPLVGTGTGEQNRVSLTFTPTAASLTLTVSGTVSNAQLEVGSTPSSYIPNLAASGTVTRAADTLTIPSANLPWPTPEVIGPELVTNGTFDTNTAGWTFEGTATETSTAGFLSGTTGGGTNLLAHQVISTEVGKTYRVQIVTGPASTAIYVGAGPASISLGSTGFSTNGERALVFKATGTSTFFSVMGVGASTPASVNNISVREINPLAVSIQMEGTMTYADKGSINAIVNWELNTSNQIEIRLLTNSVYVGGIGFFQSSGGVSGSRDTPVPGPYTPGINVPFNIASRNGSTFVNGAVDGTALTANTTPTALPDLSATDMQVGFDFMGTIKLFRVWADDLTDAGIEEASA